MSTISREQILKLAKLSKLALTEKEVEQYQRELSDILGYAERLNEVDVTGLKPTYQVSGLSNAMRQDVVAVEQQANPDALKQILPRTQGSYIEVWRMID